MKIEFDPAKDAINVEKHGVSLSRVVDMEMLAVLPDDRRVYGEQRFRAFGLIDGAAFSVAFAIRGATLRPISLRRAHKKEYDRYVSSQ